MKPKYSASPLVSTICLTPWPRLLVAACSLGAASLSQIASAESYTYDADIATASAQDGSGLGWNTTNTNWLLNGLGSNVAWPNLITDTAVFGSGNTIANAAAGTVTVGPVSVGLIEFNPTLTTGYTLAPAIGTIITLGQGITTTSTIANTISAVITGSNGLAFHGVANVTNGVSLSGLNTYTGITTTGTGGRLSGTGATPFGSTAGATASTLGDNYTQASIGNTVNLANSTAEAFQISGTGSFPSGNAPGALRIANGVTLSSLVQLAGNAFLGGNFGVGTINGNVDLAGFTMTTGNGNNPLTLTINGVASSVVGETTTGGSFVIQTGSGSASIINLTNPLNSYAGNTQVSGGTVPGSTLPSNGTLGLGGDAVLGTSTLVFAGGNVRSTDATARTISNTVGTVSGNATFGALATQTGALNFTSTAASSLGTVAKTFTTNVDTTFAAAFSNSSNITKAGAAKLSLTGTSTRTGTTTVAAGTLLINNTIGSGTGTAAVTVTPLVGAVSTFQAGAAAANSVVITGVDNATAATLRAGQAISGTNIPTDTVITGVSVGTTGTNTSAIAISKTIVPITANVAFSTTAFNSFPVLGGTGIISPRGANGLLVNSGGSIGTVDGLTEDLEVAFREIPEVVTPPTAAVPPSGTATFAAGATFKLELAAPGVSDSVKFTGLGGTSTASVVFNDNVINLSGLAGVATGSYTLFTFDTAGKYTGTPTLTGATLSGSISSATLDFTDPLAIKVNIVASDYSAWAASFGLQNPWLGVNPLLKGEPGADPDGDGLKNQQEYAFGLVPNSGSSANPIAVQLNKTTGKFSYTRRTLGLPSPALAYTVETSTNLIGWTVDAGATQTVTGTVGQIQTVEITLSAAIPLTDTKLFVRVVAQ